MRKQVFVMALIMTFSPKIYARYKKTKYKQRRVNIILKRKFFPKVRSAVYGPSQGKIAH